MGMEQMDMFSFVDNLNKDPVTNTTCVVMDGECKDVAFGCWRAGEYRRDGCGDAWKSGQGYRAV